MPFIRPEVYPYLNRQTVVRQTKSKAGTIATRMPSSSSWRASMWPSRISPKSWPASSWSRKHLRSTPDPSQKLRPRCNVCSLPPFFSLNHFPLLPLVVCRVYGTANSEARVPLNFPILCHGVSGYFIGHDHWPSPIDAFLHISFLHQLLPRSLQTLAGVL